MKTNRLIVAYVIILGLMGCSEPTADSTSVTVKDDPTVLSKDFRFPKTVSKGGFQPEVGAITKSAEERFQKRLQAVVEQEARQTPGQTSGQEAVDQAPYISERQRFATEHETKRSLEEDALRRQQVGDLSVEAPYGSIQYQYRLQAIMELRAKQGSDQRWSEAEKASLAAFSTRHEERMAEIDANREQYGVDKASEAALLEQYKANTTIVIHQAILHMFADCNTRHLTSTLCNDLRQTVPARLKTWAAVCSNPAYAEVPERPMWQCDRIPVPVIAVPAAVDAYFQYLRNIGQDRSVTRSVTLPDFKTEPSPAGWSMSYVNFLTSTHISAVGIDKAYWDHIKTLMVRVISRYRHLGICDSPTQEVWGPDECPSATKSIIANANMAAALKSGTSNYDVSNDISSRADYYTFQRKLRESGYRRDAERHKFRARQNAARSLARHNHRTHSSAR